MRCPQGSQLSLPKTLLYNMRCPQGSQLSLPKTLATIIQHAVPSGLAIISPQNPLQLPVPPGLSSLQCPRDKLSFSTFPATFRAPRARKPSESPRQAFPIQVFLQLTVLIFWPKSKMKIPSLLKLPRPMHSKISGFLNPYFWCPKFPKSFLTVS